MKGLIIATDESVLTGTGEAFNRLQDYASMLDGLTVLVQSSRKSTVPSSDKFTILSTESSSKFLAIFDSIFLSKKLIKQQEIDFIFTQDPFRSGVVGAILSRIYGVKLLVGVYGTNIFDSFWRKARLRNNFYYLVGEWVLNQAGIVQADGFEAVDALQNRLDVPVRWKPMVPRNITDFKECDKNEEEKVRLLFVGRLVTQKNLFMMTSVFNKVCENTNKETELRIVGDGPKRKELERSVREFGLEDRVIFTGWLEREDVVKEFCQADIFILTSYFEGFPRVFMEASASGLPIITTEVSGVSNVLEDGKSGFVIKQGNVEDFTNNLLSLIEDKELRQRFSQKIKDDFWSKYSYNTTLQTQENIFKLMKS